MTSREPAREDHFDLLPFIAILMCVLATELLVTMSMSTISVGAGAAEGWVPTIDPERPGKVPVLVEWDGEAAVLHADEARERIALEVQGGQPSAGLDRLLKYIEPRRDTHYALFAVRPRGFENYFRLAGEFRKRNITIGDEPVEQGKTIRLGNGGKK
jgi:hypothetical protein